MLHPTAMIIKATTQCLASFPNILNPRFFTGDEVDDVLTTNV